MSTQAQMVLAEVSEQTSTLPRALHRDPKRRPAEDPAARALWCAGSTERGDG